MQKLLPVLLISTIVLLTSCGTLQRSSNSGYRSSINDYDTDFSRDDLRADDSPRSFVGSSRALSDSERLNLEGRMDLTKAEKTLSSRREKEQYYNYKPFMKSDDERIRFLELPTVEARDRYLSSHGYLNEEKFSNETQEAIESEDIVVGMSEKAVKQSWGDPVAVEVAGNPMYGNARWKYVKRVPSSDGYLDEKKIIYFEGGRVAGWEKF